MFSLAPSLTAARTHVDTASGSHTDTALTGDDDTIGAKRGFHVGERI